MSWQHNHSECRAFSGIPRTYDPATRRYTINEFKSARYVESFTGNERQAEARCIELNRAYGGKSDYFYKAA